MSRSPRISFASLDAGLHPLVILFVGDTLELPKSAQRLGPAFPALFKAAAEGESFKGKQGALLDLVVPGDVPAARVMVMGTGSDSERAKQDWVMLGGKVMGKLPPVRPASLLLDLGENGATQAADLAMGMGLRAYRFDLYKTKKKPDDDTASAGDVSIHLDDFAGAKKAAKARDAILDGVNIARNLVNEPPNILTPKQFAARAAQLKKLGVDVEILGEREMRKIGMGALLGVGQGSVQESQLAIMRWTGAKDSKAQPIAFVGKGVVFDTGGISIKPAGGMEDMKGDMAGAACVVGLMHTLAARKAKANVIGAIGLVENMPDGAAQRPGDIVTSMSGQTIEIINTDAEGRLVLADVLWHVQAKYKPKFMVNLATLTGAIMVALGKDHAGLFSNNDELAGRLYDAGTKTGEKVWRMPMGPEYDKIIDSKFADVKNSGGRYGGSITAAQFLQRFVNECPWAHLDIAGTAMDAASTDINRSWGNGWGVRLLDRLVAEHYEG